MATAPGQRFAHLTVAYAAPSPVRDPELLFLPFEEGEERVGLPLAHRVVKNMGGSLSFEQTEDGQAVFTVRLPLGETADSRDNG